MVDHKGMGMPLASTFTKFPTASSLNALMSPELSDVLYSVVYFSRPANEVCEPAAPETATPASLPEPVINPRIWLNAEATSAADQTL